MNILNHFSLSLPAKDCCKFLQETKKKKTKIAEKYLII